MKNGRFSFSVCCTKIDTRFSVPFFTFLSIAKNEKRTVYHIFHVYRQYETRKAVCEKRIFVNIVFRVSHSTRNEKNEKRSVYEPLVRFSHFVRYKENEKRHLEPFFSFRVHKEKRIQQYGSYFVFRISHCVRNEKNEWRHCRFSFFALPEMRNTKNGP